MIKDNLLSFSEFSSLLDEAVYKGNIGIMELVKFYSKAREKDPDLIKKVKGHLAKNENDAVWKIVQDYLGVQLHGK